MHSVTNCPNNLHISNENAEFRKASGFSGHSVRGQEHHMNRLSMNISFKSLSDLPLIYILYQTTKKNAVHAT